MGTITFIMGAAGSAFGLTGTASPALSAAQPGASFHGDHFLRQGKGQGHVGRFAIGEIAIAVEQAKLSADRIIALTVPADKQLGVFAIGFEAGGFETGGAGGIGHG